MITLKETRNFVNITDDLINNDTISKIHKIVPRGELIDFSIIFNDKVVLHRGKSEDNFDTMKEIVKYYLEQNEIVSLHCLFKKYANLKSY